MVYGGKGIGIGMRDYRSSVQGRMRCEPRGFLV